MLIHSEDLNIANSNISMFDGCINSSRHGHCFDSCVILSKGSLFQHVSTENTTVKYSSATIWCGRSYGFGVALVCDFGCRTGSLSSVAGKSPNPPNEVLCEHHLVTYGGFQLAMGDPR